MSGISSGDVEPSKDKESDIFSFQFIKQLDDNLVIFPGHDYGPKPYDTLGNQKRTSGVLLAKNLEEFSML